MNFIKNSLQRFYNVNCTYFTGLNKNPLLIMSLFKDNHQLLFIMQSITKRRNINLDEVLLPKMMESFQHLFILQPISLFQGRYNSYARFLQYILQPLKLLFQRTTQYN